MLTNFDPNANFRNPSRTTARLAQHLSHESFPKPHVNPDVFGTPDIYRPSNPHVPGPLPAYPPQPTWIPPVPSGPIIEIPPNDFPLELPHPGQDDWANLPTAPVEIPDWSKLPKHFPDGVGPEIIMPNPKPNFPGKSYPDGTWLLS